MVSVVCSVDGDRMGYMVPEVASEGGMVSIVRPMDGEDGVESMVQTVDSDGWEKFYGALSLMVKMGWCL